MRAAAGGVLLGLGLLVVWSIGFPEAQAQRPASSLVSQSSAAQDRAAGGDLIVLSYDSGGTQQITVVDPRSRSLAVYQVDRVTGGLSLKSVRNVTWDLQIEDFNSNSPTPREIRALTDQR
ncbi:MAG TPA: hypothetical protein VFV87_22640 [Pirellulaceae bacterium]|nr:hypothetical protein [Pirellulaceae bacterium]